MPRKCKNWLESFRQWTYSRSEAKRSLLDWTGYFTLSAVIGRKVYIPKSKLGGWEVAPTMYVVFVGPQGAVRKSTSIGYAETLLGRIPKLTKLPEIFTAPILIEKLQAAPDSTVYGIAGEFGALMEKDEKLYISLTNLFDHKKQIDEETVGRGAKFADKPAVSLIGGTTPSWIKMNMHAAVLGTGFGSRVLYILEEDTEQRQLFWSLKGLDMDLMDKLEDDLTHDLCHIYDLLQTAGGELDIEMEGMLYLEEWYQANYKAPPGTHANMTGFYNRKPAHILKLAILLHFCYSDELIVTLEDIKNAHVEIEKIEPQIARIFSQLGGNKYGGEMDDILRYITENRRVPHPELLKVFRPAADPVTLDALIKGLHDTGEIKFLMENGKQIWVPADYKAPGK